MKHLKTATILFVLVILMSSCSNNKNSLTETYVLEHLKKCESKRPNVKVTTIPIKETRFKSNVDVTKGGSYYMELIKQGHLKLDLITNKANPNPNYSFYNITIPEQSEKYVVERKGNSNVSFKMFEINAFKVESIKMVSEIKAEVTVVYKKNRTPFYNKDYDVSTNQNKSVKPDTFTETITFRKSHTNGWIYCTLE